MTGDRARNARRVLELVETAGVLSAVEVQHLAQLSYSCAWSHLTEWVEEGKLERSWRRGRTRGEFEYRVREQP